MLSVGTKYTFKLIAVNESQNFSIVEDSIGKQYNIPTALSADTQTELVVTRVKGNQVFLSQELCDRTGMKLNSCYAFEVLRVSDCKFPDQFRLEVADSFSRTYVIHVAKQLYESLENKTTINCIVKNILGNKLILRPDIRLLNDYEEDKEYKVQITSARKSNIDGKVIYKATLKGIYGESIYINLLRWQYKYWNKFSHLSISPVKAHDGTVKYFKQRFLNLKHPFFEYGRTYNFIFRKAELNSDFGYFLGPDKILYRNLLPFSHRQKAFVSGQIVKFVYKGLKDDIGHLKLKFFIDFEDIITDYRALKRLTFDTILNNEPNSELCLKLINDYKDHQNLWIISFCEILRLRIKEFVSNSDFDSALIQIDVLLKLENWILSSGFLNTFNDKTKSETEKAANNEIENFGRLSKVLELILDGRQEAFVDEIILKLTNNLQLEIEELKILQELFKYSISTISREKLIILFYNLGVKNEKVLQKTFEINFLSILEVLRIEIDRKLSNKVFISSKERNNYYQNNDELKFFIQLNILIAKISDVNNQHNDVFLSFARIFKLCSFYAVELSDQIYYISTALSIARSDVNYFFSSFTPSVRWEHCLDIELFVATNKNIKILESKLVHYEELKTAQKSASVLKGSVIGTGVLGYEIAYKKDILILPYHLTNRLFKKNEMIEFVVKMTNEDLQPTLVTENKRLLGDKIVKSIDEIKIGDIVRGRVKDILPKSVRLNLGVLDGTIYIDDMSTQFISHPNAIFQIGQEVDVQILSIDKTETNYHCRLSRKAILKEKQKSVTEFKNTNINGTITSIDMHRGLFLELEFGHSAIVSKNDVAWNNLIAIDHVYHIGENISVKVKGIKPDGRITATCLSNANPFLKVKELKGKRFKARFLTKTMFKYWEDFFSIKHDYDNKYYCPKCHDQSSFKLYTNLSKHTSASTLYFNDVTETWLCSNCGWKGEPTSFFWIEELKVIAAAKSESVFFDSIEEGDIVDSEILYVNERNRFVTIRIFGEPIKKEPLFFTQNLNYNLVWETGSCLEHFAYLTNDYGERLNYLNLGRYFYSATSSPKSYYLKAYTDFTDIINAFEIQELNKDQILTLAQKCKELIEQIEGNKLSVEVFPVIEYMLEILTVIGALDIQDVMANNHLMQLTFDDNKTDIYGVKQLSRIILSFNLNNWSDEQLTDLLLSKFKNIIKETLTLFEKVDNDDSAYEFQKLVIKLMLKGETVDCEFKGSLDVPILTKAAKRALLNLKHDLVKAEQSRNVISIKDLQQRIKDESYIDIKDKFLIDKINFSAIKTLAAFANTSGGHLIIGIDEDEFDKPYLLGLKPDLNRFGSRDALKLRFDNLIQNYLGNAFNQFIEICEFVSLNGKEVLLIKVKKSLSEPVFVLKNKVPTFFIRRQSSTVELPADKLIPYWKNREA